MGIDEGDGGQSTPGRDISLDLELIADFYSHGLIVIQHLKANCMEEITLNDFTAKYQELYGRKPEDNGIIRLIQRIYHPEDIADAKQLPLFDISGYGAADREIPCIFYGCGCDNPPSEPE